MTQKLTTGFIAALQQEAPTLQVAKVTRVFASDRTRYRITLFDGINCMEALLDSSLTESVEHGTLKQNTIIRIKKLVWQPKENGKLLKVLKLAIIAPNIYDSLITQKMTEQQQPKQNLSAQHQQVAEQYQQVLVPQQLPCGSSTSLNSSVSVVINKTQSNSAFTAIKDLNRWSIKAKVVRKSKIEKLTSHSKKGEGLSSELIFEDETGGIEGTVNCNQASLSSSLKEQKVYYILNARLIKPESKSSICNNVYKLCLDSDTEVLEEEEMDLLLPSAITRIRELDLRRRWSIIARVAHKFDVSEYYEPDGERPLYVYLHDKSGRIKVIVEHEQKNRFRDVFEEGKVYYISGVKVCMAAKHKSLVNNEDELRLDQSASVKLCDTDSSIPYSFYEYIGFDVLEKYSSGDVVDILGVVIEDRGLSGYTTTGRRNKKREILITEFSCKVIRLTIWGNVAEQFDSRNSPIVSCIGARIQHPGRRYLTSTDHSLLKKNPDIPEAISLREWYDHTGKFHTHKP